jgi:hypothetical protein
MSFAKACREADRKQRRRPKDPRVERLRKLMADDISLERAWGELNERPQRAAESGVAALMYSLRFGVGALACPDALRRLSELSNVQLREIVVRVQKFKPYVAPAWLTEDVQVLLAARSKIHGQDA